MKKFHKIKFQVTLKVWRKFNSISVAEMCTLSGIATSTYSFIEGGDRDPKIEEFVELCGIMTVDPVEFFVDQAKL